MLIKILVILLYFFFPLMHFQVFGIGNFGITSSDLLILILDNIFLFNFFWGGKKLHIPKTSIHIFIFLLSFFMLVSGLVPLLEVNDDLIVQFAKTYAHFLYLYIFIFFGLTLKLDERLIFKILKILLFASIFVNLYGIYQLVARALDLPGGWIALNNASFLAREGEITADVEVKQLALQFKDFYRATSIFSEPSALVNYNLHNLIYLSIPFITKTKKVFENKFLNILIFTLILINLFLTFSLTAILGLSFLIFISMFLENKKLLKLYFKIFIFSAIVLVISDYIIQDIVGLSVLNLIGERVHTVLNYLLFGEDDLVSGESLTWRLQVVFDSFKVWAKSPILGVGSGLFSHNSEIANFSDNSFLALLAESGIATAFTFLTFFISIYYHSINLRRNKFLIKTPIQSSIVNMIPYIMTVQFETNFLTANTYNTVSFAVPIFFILNIISSIYINNNQGYIIKFLKVPMSERFQKNITHYLKTKSI